MSGSASSNHARPLPRSTPNACCSCAVGDAEAERGQQPAAGQPVEAGQLLGQQHRVAARAAPCTLVPNFSFLVRPAA